MTRHLRIALSIALVGSMLAGAAWAGPARKATASSKGKTKVTRTSAKSTAKAKAGTKAEEIDYARKGFYASALGMAGIPTYDDELSGTFESAFPGAGSADVGVSGGFSLRGGYRLHPRFSAELGFEWIAPYGVEVGGDEVSEINTWMFFLNTRIHVLTGRVQPYLLVGMGAYHLDFDLPAGAAGAIDATDFAPRFGGGLDYYVTRSIAITTEIDYVLGTRRINDLNYIGASLGLTYRF